MKWTTDPVTQVLAKLRDSAALQGVDFCRAYPNQMKPSRLLRPVVPKDGVPDSAGFRIFQREITGTARQVQTRLVLCCQPKLEAMYYVAE